MCVMLCLSFSAIFLDVPFFSLVFILVCKPLGVVRELHIKVSNIER